MYNYSHEIHEKLMDYPEFNKIMPMKSGGRATINGLSAEGNPVVIDCINDGISTFVAVDTILENIDHGIVKTTLDYLLNNDGTFEKPELITTLELTNKIGRINDLRSLSRAYVELREELDNDPENKEIQEIINETISRMHYLVTDEDSFEQNIISYDAERHVATIKQLGSLMLLDFNNPQ